MTYATDPQLQPADSGPMLSPGDYHWAERRGDTTGRSLMYAASVLLLILSASFSLSGPGHQWTTVTLATGFILPASLFLLLWDSHQNVGKRAPPFQSATTWSPPSSS